MPQPSLHRQYPALRFKPAACLRLGMTIPHRSNPSSPIAHPHASTSPYSGLPGDKPIPGDVRAGVGGEERAEEVEARAGVAADYDGGGSGSGGGAGGRAGADGVGGDGEAKARGQGGGAEEAQEIKKKSAEWYTTMQKEKGKAVAAAVQEALVGIMYCKAMF